MYTYIYIYIYIYIFFHSGHVVYKGCLLREFLPREPGVALSRSPPPVRCKLGTSCPRPVALPRGRGAGRVSRAAPSIRRTSGWLPDTPASGVASDLGLDSVMIRMTSRMTKVRNLRLDFRGLDSSRLLMLRSGIPWPMGAFPEI